MTPFQYGCTKYSTCIWPNTAYFSVCRFRGMCSAECPPVIIKRISELLHEMWSCTVAVFVSGVWMVERWSWRWNTRRTLTQSSRTDSGTFTTSAKGKQTSASSSIQKAYVSLLKFAVCSVCGVFESRRMDLFIAGEAHVDIALPLCWIPFPF